MKNVELQCRLSRRLYKSAILVKDKSQTSGRGDYVKQTALLLFTALFLSGCSVASADDSVPRFTEEGKFIGSADPHTIAVSLNGEETMIQVPKDKRDECKLLPDQTNVMVKYTKKDNGTLQLEDIQLRKNSS
ncbi:putative lipoprotein [Bacillus spizizenii str. W23]|uniref:Putative lipoprotein n=1 Tax=Bacillus spizizenii (strain ATCC 23059 / NRRL B-14472 / W23) TaxID=655816 RepID=E0U3D0_BACSH|nr:putative lipoprotein [Bacillus spizizenii str. W23]EFG90520.1 putative lipoprotein [Bacillus spizizenii ATCC 6633 = JCM 2499]